ncbi:esterase [Gordonia phage Wojtek]|uniref:Esterase n=1 Tax=Gordonia phage Wojtek TaxID=2910758 RepID=A0AA49BMS2_9CAUD|nr:esterase [Gordonia phage Wojtek]
MANVWYIGEAQERRLTLGGQEYSWNIWNGWSIPESAFTAGQLAELDADPGFLLGQSGPRVNPPWTPDPSVGRNDTLLQKIIDIYNEIPGRLGKAALDATYARAVPKVWSVDPAVAGAGYTPTQRTAYFHDLCSQITAAGGSNVIEFPALEFVVAIEGTTPSLSGSTKLFTVPSGTSLHFRPGTKFTVADASAASSNLVLLWQFGASTDPAANFTVRDAAFYGKSKANGKSFWAAGNRRDTPAAKIDNVIYENCLFDDITVGVTNARRNPGGSLGANRDSNWRVINCDFNISNNRAIELSQTNGALIQGNVFTDVESAIHLLIYTENVKCRDNRGTCRTSGIHINAHVHNCEFDGGRFDFVAGQQANYGTMHFHTEPNIASYETSDLTIRNHWFGCPDTGSNRKSLTFMSTQECESARINRIKFFGCEFEGDVNVTPFYTKPGHEMADWVFTDCDFYGNFSNVASSTHNIHDWRFINCRFHSTTGQVINADRMFFRNCEFVAVPTIAASASQVEMVNCTTPGAVVDNGAGSIVTGTVVRTGPKINPATLSGATVWDADDLTAGAVTTWAPKSGGVQSAAFGVVGGAPTVLDAAINGHKSVQFTAASSQRLLTSTFGTSVPQPSTLMLLWKSNDTAADQHLLSGGTLNQPVIRKTSGGQLAYRANAAGKPIQPAVSFTHGQWHATIAVFNGANSRVYTDTLSPQSGTLTEVEALTALRLGSSGTGNSPFLDGEVQMVGLINRAATTEECAGIMRWLTARVGWDVA